MQNNHDKYKYYISVILILYIAVIIVFRLLTPDKIFSDSENRNLEQKPKFTFSKLVKGQFAKNFEKYIADQFPKRDFWIGVKAGAEKLSGKKENNNVYLGKDGYLLQKFLRPEGSNLKDKVKAINSFSALIPGINQYFMLVPNSIEVLRDKLPLDAPREDQLIYMNKVKNSLNKNIKFINVYDTLYSKRNEYIYYKTDHHWTTAGAYYAYEKFCADAGAEPADKGSFNIKKVTDSFYGTSYSMGGFRDIKADSIELYISKTNELRELQYSEDSKKTDSIYDMGSLSKKDKYSVFLDGNHPLVTIKTNAHNNRRILVVKDSYANSFIPFLLSDYSEIYAVDLRYYDDSILDLIKANKISDVLILYNVNTFFEDESIKDICYDES